MPHRSRLSILLLDLPPQHHVTGVDRSRVARRAHQDHVAGQQRDVAGDVGDDVVRAPDRFVADVGLLHDAAVAVGAQGLIEQVHAAGGPGPLAASIDQWRERITARGRAMLTGSARLANYLSFLELSPRDTPVSSDGAGTVVRAVDGRRPTALQ